MPRRCASTCGPSWMMMAAASLCSRARGAPKQRLRGRTAFLRQPLPSPLTPGTPLTLGTASRIDPTRLSRLSGQVWPSLCRPSWAYRREQLPVTSQPLKAWSQSQSRHVPKDGWLRGLHRTCMTGFRPPLRCHSVLPISADMASTGWFLPC